MTERRRTLLVLVLLLRVVLGGTPAFAQATTPQPRLTATPNPVPAGFALGTTEVSWDTGDGSPGTVTVSVDGSVATLFATGTRGSSQAPWLKTGKVYQFVLYRDAAPGQPVASLAVTRQDWSLAWAIAGLVSLLGFLTWYLSTPSLAGDTADDPRLSPHDNAAWSGNRLWWLIPILACVSLLTSSVLVAGKRALWNDEILSLVLIDDPSFSHMLGAWGDTFNQAPPGYFILGWVLDKVFGSSELALRLPGSLFLCCGLLLTWQCARKAWGEAAAGFGVVGVFGFSTLVLYHNAEARMYGLFVATCALGLSCYQRLSSGERPGLGILVLNALAQGTIVLTHLFGMLYSGTFLLSLLCTGAVARPSRRRVYASFAAGWATLLPCVPGLIRQSNNQAKWFEKVPLQEFLSYYNPSRAFDYYLVLILCVAAALFVASYVKRSSASLPSVGAPVRRKEAALIVVAIVLVAVPVIPWILTVTVRPMLSERNVIPSLTLGWSLLLACAVRRLVVSSAVSKAWQFLVVVLLAAPPLIYPTWSAYKFPPQLPPGRGDAAFGYVDLPIALEAGHDYLPRMHYSAQPTRYYHIRDWDTAVRNTSSVFATGDYTHMAAVARHFSYVHSVESAEFLQRYNRFLVWNEPDQKWFEWRLRADPSYKVTHLGSDHGANDSLELYLVEKEKR